MSPLDVIEGRARWCVVEGDSADVLASLPPASVHALVTDPPAGIGFMGREWDRDRGGRAQWVAWLASVLGLARVAVRPGGRAFVWALPRTTHWTGCAVEDAGWSVETVVTHLFGTGWPKGQGQLKPSSEHWYLARTGPSTGLNVDGCRVGADRRINPPTGGKGATYDHGLKTAAQGAQPSACIGRWPPNTLLSHSPGCERVGERRVKGSNAVFKNTTEGDPIGSYSGGLRRQPAGEYGHADPDGTELVESWQCDDGCPVAVLDAQSGDRPSGSRAEGVRKGLGYGSTTDGDGGPALEAPSGPASRFFPCFPADSPGFAYIAKPSRAERNTGIEAHGPPLAPGKATMATCEKADWSTRNGNHHPTVKPVALMRWLLRLITEPGDIVLDPFGGSGTTGVAALLEGRRVIIIERDPAFAAICRARLSHAAPTAADLTARVAAPIAAPAPDFGPLFGGAR